MRVVQPLWLWRFEMVPVSESEPVVMTHVIPDYLVVDRRWGDELIDVIQVERGRRRSIAAPLDVYATGLRLGRDEKCLGR